MSSSYRILVVDDDRDFCNVLRESPEAREDFSIAVRRTAAECVAEINK